MALKKRVAKRSPLNRRKNVLTVPEKEGYVRRWVNDIGNRVAEAQEMGYSVVEEKEVEVGDRGVTNQNQSLGTGARKHAGGGVSCILMEIPKDEYDVIQEQKREDVAEIEAELQRNVKRAGDYGDGLKITR